jgi:hypothetical protein
MQSVRLARELSTSESADLGPTEPLIRERFISYLIEHEQG